jgi:hypothetical protein
MRMTLAYLALVAGLIAPLSAQPAYAQKPVVEVAFVLDTTGSMSGLIENAKRKIWSIATSIVDANPSAEVKMALVAYRDIGDEYVTRKFDLTTDIQGLYAELLKFRAQGGGDWPESVNEALHAGVARMSWTHGPQTTRILFLVGDAPPHMDYEQDKKYPEVLEIARKKGIIVNAVQAGAARDTEKVWRTVAQLGRGDYISIPQDGGQVVIIETPYDRDIIELQGQINRTVVPYGTRERQQRVEQKTRQVTQAPAASASDMTSYINKRATAAKAAPEAVTGDGDLVGDIAAGRASLGGVKDEELPEPLRRMSPEDRKAHVESQLAARRALNEKLSGLVAKRDAHVAAERNKQEPARTGDSFDRAVESTLRAQIKR